MRTIRQFGNFNLELLYKQVIKSNIEGIELSETDEDVLFVAVCLADIKSGVCIDPETERPCGAEVLLNYTPVNSQLFYASLEKLQDNNLVNYLRDKTGQFILIISDYIRQELERVWRKNQRPLLLLKRKALKRLESADYYKALEGLSPRAGYVYLAHAENGLYKIGKARDPKDRVKTFAGAVMPFDISLVHVIFSQDYHQAESMMHQRFSHRRRSGEWFELSTQEVNEIMSMNEISV